MSDAATKPEEVKPVVAEEPKVEENVPVMPASTIVPVGATDAAVAVTGEKPEDKPADEKAEETKEPKDEEAKDEKPEPKEITHGILSKNHGGLLAFFKQKRFFYFQDEAIPEDQLKTYLHKESHTKATAAFATQTGKGLLLYSKDEAHKVPHGIIKLADVTEVAPVGATKFVLKQTHGDLHFEAPAAERDSWVHTLKTKIADAKTANETITESDGYKAALEKFTHHPVAAKPVEKPAEKAEEKETTEAEEPKTEAAEKTETEIPAVAEDEAAESKDVKRNASTANKAKRTSLFGFFDKKEKAEEKKDDKKDEIKEESKAEETKESEAPVLAPVDVTDAAPTEAAAKEAEETKPVEAKPAGATSPKEATSPKTTKRLSFFGGFNKKKVESPSVEKKEEEAKAETPAVAETEAPAPAVETAETESETKPIDVPVTDSAAPEKLTVASSPKSKFNLSSFIKREKSPAPKNEEVKAEDKVEEKAEDKPEEKMEAPVVLAAEPTTTEAAKETPAEETTVETAATSPKETKRKSSFFSGFKGKKPEEKTGDEAVSESDAPKAVSPVSKFGGLIRKASRSSSKPAKEAEKKEEVAAPATLTEEPEAVSAEPVKTEAAAEPAAASDSADKPVQSIGDVVPEAVNVEKTPSVKASA